MDPLLLFALWTLLGPILALVLGMTAEDIMAVGGSLGVLLMMLAVFLGGPIVWAYVVYVFVQERCHVAKRVRSDRSGTT